MMLGTAAQLQSVGTTVRTVDVAGTSLPLIDELKTLGVMFDSHFRFDKHAAAVTRACNYHLRALRHIRNALSDDVAKRIGCSIVGAKLDYCNSLLYGSPASTLGKLQRAQNQLARIVTKSDWRADAMPILRKLHWLPIRQRIIFKMAVLTYKVRSTATPEYLVSLLQPYDTGRTLRSSTAPRLFVPRTRTETTQRAFTVAAPNVWNSLPDSIRLSDSITTFKRRLETYLFTTAFN
jgi:hypothetical protein